MRGKQPYDKGNDTLVITPPLIINEQEIDEAIDILDKSLEIADKEAVETDVPAARSCDYLSWP